MNFLRSLASLNMKKYRFHAQPVNIVLVVILILLFMVEVPHEIHTLVTSIPMRIVYVLATIAVVSNYGVVSGMLVALLFIVLLTDVRMEGMTNNNTTNSKDPVKDALDKVHAKSIEKPLPPPSSATSETRDTTPIETAVADKNEQGTISQIDKDRAMKLSSHMNSKDDSIVEQMKKEKEIEKSQTNQTKEGFTPMASMTSYGGSYGGSSLSGSMV